ncbi:uncharacterized protein LOC127721612 isoform X2 [Mytilus californianus]|uniref:uncharacterized protein LOC127721612 isoform X2 n=1 Tax=Mytilus californianus TaxID=6549 RepID=UPI0022462A9F|nr:uncharacterized protein LOC127721612 isoform X2 [Mytilus californianus]
MSTGKTPLFWVFTLVLQLNIVATAIVAAGCPVSPFIGRPLCNETCWKPPRIPHGEQFTCNIGYNTEWQDFSQTHGLEFASLLNNTASELFKPPILTNIALYPLPYKDNKSFSPALNVSFKIKFLGKPSLPETKAILLTFESPVLQNQAYKKFIDQAYSVQKNKAENGRIYRIFNFSKYIPDSYDVEKPIPVAYPCLYGLDDCGGDKKIYTITLTSITMNSTYYSKYFKCSHSTCSLSSLTYTVSVVPVRYNVWNIVPAKACNSDFEKWNATIATTFYPSPNDIYVVFEHRNTFSSYFVKYTGGIYEKTALQNHTFKNLPPGQYVIEVKCCREDHSCIEYKSFHEIIIEASENLNSINEKTIHTIFATVSGICLAVILLITLAWLKKRRKNISNNDSEHIEQHQYVIISNTNYADEVIAIQLESAIAKFGIENDCILRRNNLKYGHENSTILILLPVEHESFKMRISEDKKYKEIIESISKRKLKNIFLVYFPYIKGAKRVRWSCLQKFKTIRLTKDFYKMIKKMNINYKHFNKNLLCEIRSELEVVVKRIEQIFQMQVPTSADTLNIPIRNSTDRFDGMDHFTSPKTFDRISKICEQDSCKIHKPITQRCPVHHPRFHPQTFPDNMMYTTNLTNIHQHETIPLLGSVIPPSPESSEKNPKYHEPFRTNSGESGYGPSRMNSSSDDDLHKEDALADDDSLINQIMSVNRDHLPSTPSEIDPMLAINFQM